VTPGKLDIQLAASKTLELLHHKMCITEVSKGEASLLLAISNLAALDGAIEMPML
jgi:hypothetical protein